MRLLFLTVILIMVGCDNSSNQTSHSESSADSEIRLVTLAPHLAELVASAGALDHLVGVVEYSKFPTEVQSIEKIGDAFLINFEALISLKPSLVLTWKGGTSRSVINKLQSMNIPYMEIEINRLEDIPKAILSISRMTDTVTEAHKSVQEFEDKLKKYQSIPKPQKTAFIQITQQPLFTVSSQHWMSEAVSLCGLNNVFSELPQISAPVTTEAVLSANPDYIINVSVEESSLWDQWMGHTFQPRMIDVNPEFFSVPSLRIMQAIEQICSET